MKIYVNEESQDVRIDFGEEEYARVSVSRFTGQVFTEVSPASWLPDTLGDSELVYETPEPELEWPTKPNALVIAEDLYRKAETYVREFDYWVNLNGDAMIEKDLKLVRIIFEGEDTQ